MFKKTAIIIISVISLVFGIAGCSKTEYTDTEKFAARANVTINRNIWNYIPGAVNFTFTTLEYYEGDSGERVVRADCGFLLHSGDVVRGVFVLSDNDDYLATLGAREYLDIDYIVEYDDVTELFYISLGPDYEFTPDPDNFVDRQAVGELAQKYFETEDKSYIGM